MKVIIERISSEPGAPCRVRFRSEVGAAEAEWRTGVPLPGKGYLVEMEVPGRLTWGKNIAPVDPQPARLATTPEGIVVCGTLEHAESDGWTAIRLGESLVVVEADGQPPNLWTPVSFTTPTLVLYPHDGIGRGLETPLKHESPPVEPPVKGG